MLGMHHCKNICGRFQAPKGKRNYKSSGRCSLCSMFMTIPEGEILCPCCGYKLRISIRTERWRNETEYKRISA